MKAIHNCTLKAWCKIQIRRVPLRLGTTTALHRQAESQRDREGERQTETQAETETLAMLAQVETHPRLEPHDVKL